MKAHRCPSCGASLRGNENVCPYCNTSYKTDDTKISIEIIPPKIDNTKKFTTRTKEEVVNELLKLKVNTRRSIFATVIPLVFFAIFASSMFFTFSNSIKVMITIDKEFPLFAILPVVIMMMAIVSVGLSIFSRPSQRYLKKVINLLQDGEIDDAFTFAKSKMHTTNTLIGVAVIIAFYLKQDYIFATINVKRVNAYTFIEFEKHTDLLTNAAFELDFVPPNK